LALANGAVKAGSSKVSSTTIKPSRRTMAQYSYENRLAE
jgi:hypothetical protein